MLFYFFTLFLLLHILYYKTKNKFKKSFFNKYSDAVFLNKFLLPFSNFSIYLYDKKKIFDYTYYKNLVTLQKNAVIFKHEFLNNFGKFKLTQPGIFSGKFGYDSNYGYYFIKFFGLIRKNQQHFPKLYKYISTMPNIRTCFISVMNSKKLIPLHHGPNKGILRFHLPLINVNPDQSFLQVENTKLYWKDHTPFLFDDNFKHKAVKKDNDLRVVIICDIERKLPYELTYLNKLVLYLLKQDKHTSKTQKKLVLKKI